MGGRNKLPSAEQLKHRWNLTPKEADFSLMLLGGNNIAESAKQLSMTLETGRWYCKRVMEKVGVNRQVELVLKLMQDTLPD
ncbi:MAG TPA: helix-turn-helix transcriptional regulator [Spongiibacteraceae bacterium]|jgi:DNA-binding CsgD family transcriptional regulator